MWGGPPYSGNKSSGKNIYGEDVDEESAAGRLIIGFIGTFLGFVSFLLVVEEATRGNPGGIPHEVGDIAHGFVGAALFNCISWRRSARLKLKRADIDVSSQTFREMVLDGFMLVLLAVAVAAPFFALRFQANYLNAVPALVWFYSVYKMARGVFG